MTFPKYRYLIIDGVCRQDFPGDRWHQLTLEETDQLLSRFDGQTIDRPLPPETVIVGSTFHYSV